MKKITLIFSLLSSLFFPFVIDNVSGSEFFHFNSKKSLLFFETYTRPYQDILLKISNRFNKKKEVTNVYIHTDYHGKTYFSNMPPDGVRGGVNSYQVKSEYTGRFSVPVYWAYGAILTLWFIFYCSITALFSLVIVKIFPKYFSEKKSSNRGSASTLNNAAGESKIFELPPVTYHSLSSREILGVSETASLEEIKKAYQIKLQQYHPDKVTHLGAEFQEMAKEKTMEIIKSYKELLKTN